MRKLEAGDIVRNLPSAPHLCSDPAARYEVMRRPTCDALDCFILLKVVSHPFRGFIGKKLFVESAYYTLVNHSTVSFELFEEVEGL